MGCRSDYMEPTKSERAQLTEYEKALKTLNDELVHSADEIREAVISMLDNGWDGNTHNYPLRQAFAHLVNSKTAYGDRLVKDIKGAYAYNGKSTAVTVYERASSEYCAAAQAYLKLMSDEDLTENEIARIRVTQEAHRKEDLKRLAKVFIDTDDFVSAQKVLAADPTKPLHPQLGFDPDKF